MKPPSSESRVFMNCRTCWERIQLEPSRVERTESGYAYRCQHCEGSFLLRVEDALAIDAGGEQAPPTDS